MVALSGDFAAAVGPGSSGDFAAAVVDEREDLVVAAAAEVLDVVDELDLRVAFFAAAAVVVFDFFGGLAPGLALRLEEVYDFAYGLFIADNF